MKNYCFWFPETKSDFRKNFNKNNPYSGLKGTLKTAHLWAENLLNNHRDELAVSFMAENGRKIYTVYRWFDCDGLIVMAIC